MASKLVPKLSVLLLIGLIFLISCSRQPEPVFSLLSWEHTNIDFVNEVEDTIEFNILNYLYFYDGAGVAVGDINNNGMPDLFFVGNEVENRMYLNKGDFVFEDITHAAGVAGDPGSWSKGAAMADVNGNGYLDIYVSRVNYLNKEGANQLFVNNGDGTFTERAAEFGLDFRGYSTQAVFLDYNKNGRLDLFLLNHSFHSDKTYGPADELRQIDDPKAGDRLFRNDGDRFTEVTHEAGIITSALGYGLGVAVSDITLNGWPDIYVGNDFLEDDYLYINNGDGTFTEALYSSVGHTSRSSMGNDIADVTNNGRVDIISLDMMPEDHEIYMRSGGPDIQEVYDHKIELGFGHKNARNTLQINRGQLPDGTPVFSDIAFLAGVAKTDWSWASLFADLNNSGWKDLLVTNGMVRRPNDMDFVVLSDSFPEREMDEPMSPEEFEAIQTMPELRIPNYLFQNNGDLTFTDRTMEWGLAQPAFSSGAAYADLNGNGRLDLVINNLNGESFIYRNNTPEDASGTSYIQVQLRGDGFNTSGIGSKVIFYKDDLVYFQEQMPTRGYQSSVDHLLHFGFGGHQQLDSLLVIWPDDRFEVQYNIPVNQTLILEQRKADGRFDYSRFRRSWNHTLYRDVTSQADLDYRHQEYVFDDYSREPSMPYRLTTQGPALAVGDVNGNGLDDLFLGGAKGQSGALFFQQEDGRFVPVQQHLFDEDAGSEDVDAIFFDATGNGMSDLYVVSGGGELTGNDTALSDRFYINNGEGFFEKSANHLPDLFVNGSVVRPADINGNGHTDLFVAGRSIPFRYGLTPQHTILMNDGNGYFRDATEEIAPELSNAGMITDAQWAYISNDQYPDLIVAAEWMPLQYFANEGGQLHDRTSDAGFENYRGLWQSLLVEDITGDGLPDIVAGNFGLNSRIQASPDKPFRLYLNDFADMGQPEPVLAYYRNGDFYPFDQHELMMQFDRLSRTISSYREYSEKSIRGLFGNEKERSSMVRDLTDLRTSLFINNGDGTFSRQALPNEAQFSPVMAIHAVEKEAGAGKDLILAGNLLNVRPATGGRQDAGFGLYLRNPGNGEFEALEFQSSGVFVPGEARALKEVRTSDGRILIVARNDDTVLFFKPNE
jgi:enediyne biosynthesis protein E4